MMRVWPSCGSGASSGAARPYVRGNFARSGSSENRPAASAVLRCYSSTGSRPMCCSGVTRCYATYASSPQVLSTAYRSAVLEQQIWDAGV